MDGNFDLNIENLLGKKTDENTDITRVYCKGMPQWTRLEKARDILNKLCPEYPEIKTDYFEVKQKVWRDFGHRNFGRGELHTTLVGFQDTSDPWEIDSWQIDFCELNDILNCDENDLEKICKKILDDMKEEYERVDRECRGE